MPYFENRDASIYYRTSGAGATGLIFIHGWYQTGSEAWISLARNLKPGYRIFLPDLPGHGLSDDVSPNFSIANNSQLIESFVEHARKSYRLKKVILIGHSYGAFATLDIIARQNVAIDAAVAISAIDDYAPYVRRLKQALWVPGFLTGLYYRLQAALALFPYGDRLHLYGAMPQSLQPGRMAYAQIKNHTLSVASSRVYMRAFLTGKVKWPDGKIKVPLLLVYGERDALTPARHADAINPHFAKSEVVVLPKSGHNVQISAAEPLARALTGFVEKSLRRAVAGKHGSHVRRH
ncbi:alpha/beta fold hydrolase [Turneriella parva]|uniref:Alpha/beta hydrolase fold containing protein n=1 Tax=Turneriella parva (strain ATCC BAA-1111 / DSM 21527 / NCTC 11395 / H) TaxID=869212 RepID=I4B3P3_TURPD|nr:alpha/beta hydrolase [Turneriella parva]AFM11900.1 alpha/beta hydrolase fold containing protein [Turneriella parva DSM 21527]